MNKPYPDTAARQYPPGKKPDWRRIVKCSERGAWYAGMVGETITVHYFCSFGAWDTQGRWLWYYDLSEPVDEPISKRIENKISWIKKLFK